MKAQFFTPNDRMSATAEQLHAALNAWLTEWNAARSRQACGGHQPIERFRLADRPIVHATATMGSLAREAGVTITAS
jgi:hypothetical protein